MNRMNFPLDFAAVVSGADADTDGPSFPGIGYVLRWMPRRDENDVGGGGGAVAVVRFVHHRPGASGHYHCYASSRLQRGVRGKWRALHYK